MANEWKAWRYPGIEKEWRIVSRGFIPASPSDMGRGIILGKIYPNRKAARISARTLSFPPSFYESH